MILAVGGALVGLLAPIGQEIASRLLDRARPTIDRWLPDQKVPELDFEPVREENDQILARVTGQGAPAFVYRVMFCPAPYFAAVLPSKQVLRTWRDDCSYDQESAMEISKLVDAGRARPYCDLVGRMEPELLPITSEHREVVPGHSISLRFKAPAQYKIVGVGDPPGYAGTTGCLFTLSARDPESDETLVHSYSLQLCNRRHDEREWRWSREPSWPGAPGCD